MSKHFALELITPTGKVYSGEVESVQLPGEEGRFQVLYNHAPMIAMLQKGEVKVVEASHTKQSFYIDKGVFEVLNNQAVILAESIVAR